MKKQSAISFYDDLTEGYKVKFSNGRFTCVIERTMDRFANDVFYATIMLGERPKRTERFADSVDSFRNLINYLGNNQYKYIETI